MCGVDREWTLSVDEYLRGLEARCWGYAVRDGSERARNPKTKDDPPNHAMPSINVQVHVSPNSDSVASAPKHAGHSVGTGLNKPGRSRVKLEFINTSYASSRVYCAHTASPNTEIVPWRGLVKACRSSAFLHDLYGTHHFVIPPLEGLALIFILRLCSEAKFVAVWIGINGGC